MKDIDWNLLRAFHATAAAGSLSSAARRLGLSQPTLSRQIAALEASLGLTLFDRIGKRLVLTETGQGLLEHVRAMGDAADATILAATGRAEAVAGRVSISATDAYAAYMLPDAMARIRAEAPDVTVLVIASNSLSDLRRREADIAIRHVQPEEPELIGRVIRRSTAHYWASGDWVERHGRPERPQEIARHLIGFHDAERFAAHLRGTGLAVEGDDFRIVSESAVVVWEMVRRGLGVGLMLSEIAARTPGMVNLFPDHPPVEVPVWLVTHRELRTNRRIRVVYDILADTLAG